MSFILDALKKAERERQRGAIPTLESPGLADEPRPLSPLRRWGVPVALVVVAVVAAAVGWVLRPQEPSAPVATVAPAAPATMTPGPSAPPRAVAPPDPVPAEVTPPPAEPFAAEPVPVAAAGQRVLGWQELPGFVRQEVPAMSLSLHYYDPSPAARMVMINNRMLREGQVLQPGLLVDEIRPRDVVFRAHGYRFTVDGVAVP